VKLSPPPAGGSARNDTSRVASGITQVARNTGCLKSQRGWSVAAKPPDKVSASKELFRSSTPGGSYARESADYASYLDCGSRCQHELRTDAGLGIT
jgi:hypothetical protein